MPNYEASRHNPPAPVAAVTFRDATNGTSASGIFMLMDTGADISLVPRAVVEQLGMKPIKDLAYELVGFDGSRQSAPAVELDLIFLRKIFRGKYVITDDNWGIMGRDVLASMAILLDGPHQQWLEYQPPP